MIISLHRLNSHIQKKLTIAHTRSLTTGEKILVHSVFGDNLLMEDIRLKTAWWVLKNYAVIPNRNVYFHHEYWVEDFADESPHRQAWLIHELTHVWQLQQGLNVVRKALLDRRYDYFLKDNKSFFKYGIEQQACMVEDYFVQMNQGQDCEALKACIPFL